LIVGESKGKYGEGQVVYINEYAYNNETENGESGVNLDRR
jgi:hypothetical protein